MRNLTRFVLSAAMALPVLGAGAQSLVLLHTNDTHSHIDADKGVGGVLQRKAIADSVRAAEKNVLMIDAGDIVQGTLYYKLFHGEVEYPLMGLLGYDMQILGNHEFDNGVDELAKYYTKQGPVKLASNYSFTHPELKNVFEPWLIRDIDGKKVGFMGMNLNPEGIIGEANSQGVIYRDILATADSTAKLLRDRGCSLVVAVTHIGYTDDTGLNLLTDPQLAAGTSGIDIIIGGHSHSLVAPGTALQNVVMNRDGKPVLIAQTGRYGANLGYIKVDLSNPEVSRMEARMIPVAGVDSSKFDSRVKAYIAPYRHAVDSINARVIARNDLGYMMNSKKYHQSRELTNLTADIASLYASRMLDSIAAPGLPRKVDFAMINSGGIRLPFPQGEVTEGQVLSAFPFSNYLVVVEMKGNKLRKLIEQAVNQGGQGFSKEVVAYVYPSGKPTEVWIDGKPLDPERNYYIATLDYLAGGGDYMTEFKNGRVVAEDSREFCAPVMDFIVTCGKEGRSLPRDERPRAGLLDEHGYLIEE